MPASYPPSLNVSDSPSKSPDERFFVDGGSGEATFSPADLFSGSEVGDYWDMTDVSTLYQDTSATTPVTTPGDPVGRVDGQRGRHNFLQSSTTLKGTWSSPTGSSRTGLTVDRDWLNADLEAFSPGTSLGPTVTMAFSVVFTNDDGTSPVVIGTRQDATNLINAQRLSSTADEAYIGALIGGTGYNTSNGTYTLATEYNVLAGHDNSAPELFLNVDGSEATVASANQTEWGSDIYIGANSNALGNTDFMLRGTVFRGCVINRVLTSQEKTDLLTWLAGEA